jgi:TetR/AcrR family transcriptional repressor of nem operon
MPQLLEASGLSRSSFYSAFGDKRQSFIKSLELYASSLDEKLEYVRKSDDAIDAIRFYLESPISMAENGIHRFGCLLLNSLVEFESTDADLYKTVHAYTKTVQACFYDCFERSIRVGNLTTDLTPSQLVLAFSTFRAGILIRERAGISKDEARFLHNFFIASIQQSTPKTFSEKTTH